ncbi:MAG: hypothetical protein NTX86_00730 [Candidatus Dependentiae bacterium]|nr:hypothetical protein [Candidatus Dependentiae bacterium]
MKFRLNHYARLEVHIVLSIFSALIFSYLLYKPISTFNPIGQESFVLPVTPEVTKQWGKEPVHVKMGLTFHQFLKFNVIQDDFLVTAVIWFEFDPTKVSLDTISKFSFTKGNIVQKSDPIVIKISDTKSFVKYHLRIEFNTILDYTMFPLDNHKLFLNFTNTAVDADQVVFDVAPKAFVIPKYLTVSGWNIVEHNVKSGYTEYEIPEANQTAKEPKVVFSLGIQKKDIRQLMIMLLPILLLFYFCVFMLTIDDFSLKIQNMLMIITAYMAYNVVIQSMSPNIGYFMLIDYVMLLFIIAMFIIFIVLMLGNLPEKILSKTTYEKIKGGTVLLVYAMVIGFMFYLTNFLA